MTVRRVDPWHPPVTPGSLGVTGVITIATTFLDVNAHPWSTALIGAGLVGAASWLSYYRNSGPSAGGDSATTVADSKPTRAHR